MGLDFRTSGYRLTQAVRVESADVSIMRGLDSASQQLVEQGVLFTTQQGTIFFGGSDEAKIAVIWIPLASKGCILQYFAWQLRTSSKNWTVNFTRRRMRFFPLIAAWR